MAIVIVALLCAWAIRRGKGRTVDARLLLVWMTWCGLFMALPQVAIGALNPLDAHRTGPDGWMAAPATEWCLLGHSQ